MTLARSNLSPAAVVTRRWRAFVVTASVVAASMVYMALPLEMGELGRRAVAIAVFAAALWATEAIPLFAASLSVVGLEVLLLARQGGGDGAALTQLKAVAQAGVEPKLR